MIRFIVLFKLLDHSEENVALIREHIMSLERKMSVLQHIEVGSNLLYGERSSDLAAIFDFNTMEDLHLFEHHTRVFKRLDKLMGDLMAHRISNITCLIACGSKTNRLFGKTRLMLVSLPQTKVARLTN